MSFIASLRTRYLGWSHSAPLPDLPDAGPPAFQRWHVFDNSASKWAAVQPGHVINTKNSPSTSQAPKLRLLTWNIDAFGESHESRMEGILSEVQQMRTGVSGPDIVFFQEVSRKALNYLLQHAWVRETWILSEADETNWANVPFATVILLSHAQFGIDGGNFGSEAECISTLATAASSDALFSLGPVWRVNYPSRYNRDALCCDIFWNRTTRIRLINVHLDSLPMQPNRRPRQVAIVASLLRTAGVDYGIVAGDWNPVMEEDKGLVQLNGLVDAWEHLHPDVEGFTWGLDGMGAPFPPNRLDKVAVLGLRPVDMKVVHPGTVSTTMEAEGEEEKMPWSDHSGLICTFSLGQVVALEAQ